MLEKLYRWAGGSIELRYKSIQKVNFLDSHPVQVIEKKLNVKKWRDS